MKTSVLFQMPADQVPNFRATLEALLEDIDEHPPQQDKPYYAVLEFADWTGVGVL